MLLLMYTYLEFDKLIQKYNSSRQRARLIYDMTMKAKISVSSNKILYEIRRIWPSWMLGGTSACSLGCWHRFAPSFFGRRPAPKAGTFNIEF